VVIVSETLAPCARRYREGLLFHFRPMPQEDAEAAANRYQGARDRLAEHVGPARILGAEAQGELSSAEAREMSEALKAVADQADRLDVAMIPHLEAALEAGKAVTK
jgi:hypothetical protein